MNKRVYKEVKNGSFTPIYYLYISNYKMGRILGDVLVFLVIVSSLIMGKITNNYIIDTYCFALSIGSLIYNYRVIKMLYIGTNTGYFREGISDEYFHTLKRLLGPMTMLSRFAEVYSIFAVAIFFNNIILKITASILIIAAISAYKIKFNFVNNKPVSVVIYNSIAQIIVLALSFGLKVFITDIALNLNIILILILVLCGILKYTLDKSLRKVFVDEYDNFNKKNIEIDIMKIRDIFGLEITKKNEKNWKEIEEEIKEKEYRNSEEYKKKEEERQREEQMKIAEIKMAIQKEEEEEFNKTKKEQKELKEKIEMEAEKKKALKTARRGKTLTEEQKEIVREEESKQKINNLDDINSNRRNIKR